MTDVIIPTSIQHAVTEKNTFNNIWFLFFQNLAKAVRGSLNLKLSGVLFNSTNSVTNTGGTTNLISYDLQKNILSNNQDMLEIKVSGSFSANANNKQVQLYFGSQIIFDTGVIAANNSSWSFEATILKTSISTQEINVTAIFNDVARTSIVSGTQDTTNGINVKCVGIASVSDITQRSLIIKLTPYN